MGAASTVGQAVPDASVGRLSMSCCRIQAQPDLHALEHHSFAESDTLTNELIHRLRRLTQILYGRKHLLINL